METPPERSLQPNKSTIMVNWYEENREELCKQQVAKADGKGGQNFLEISKKNYLRYRK